MSKPEIQNSGFFQDLPKDRLVAARARSSLRQRAADAIREEAKQVAYTEGFDLGQQVGYSEGFEQGRREALAQFGEELSGELSAVRSELEVALSQMEGAVSDFYLDAERQLADIAKEVVARVLDAELVQNDEAILGIVRAAMRDVAQSREVSVRVNVVDSAVLVNHEAAILQAFSHIKSFDIVADPTIQAGCLIESDYGSVDARPSSALRLISGDAA